MGRGDYLCACASRLWLDSCRVQPVFGASSSSIRIFVCLNSGRVQHDGRTSAASLWQLELLRGLPSEQLQRACTASIRIVLQLLRGFPRKQLQRACAASIWQLELLRSLPSEQLQRARTPSVRIVVELSTKRSRLRLVVCVFCLGIQQLICSRSYGIRILLDIVCFRIHAVKLLISGFPGDDFFELCKHLELQRALASGIRIVV